MAYGEIANVIAEQKGTEHDLLGAFHFPVQITTGKTEIHSKVCAH